MNTIKQFIANHSALAHTLVVVWGFLAGFYFDNATAHNYIDGVALNLYNSTPHWLQGAIVGLIIPLITYWKAQKNAAARASTGSTQKLGALALCALLLMGTTMGCTQAQKISVAQEIVNWTPTLISAVDTSASMVESLDPASALIVAPFVVAFNALAPQFQMAAKNYLANPTQTTLQVLQSLITQIQQNANQALLAALKITNPTSQSTVTKDINIVATAANALLSLVQSVSTQAQIQQMSKGVTVTLAQVHSLMDQNQLQQAALKVSNDLHTQPITVAQFYRYEAQHGF